MNKISLAYIWGWLGELLAAVLYLILLSLSSPLNISNVVSEIVDKLFWAETAFCAAYGTLYGVYLKDIIDGDFYKYLKYKNAYKKYSNALLWPGFLFFIAAIFILCKAFYPKSILYYNIIAFLTIYSALNVITFLKNYKELLELKDSFNEELQRQRQQNN